MLSSTVIRDALASVVDEPALFANSEGKVVLATRAFCARYGVREETLRGAPISELCGRDISSDGERQLRLALPGAGFTAPMDVVPLRFGRSFAGWLCSDAAGTGSSARGFEYLLAAIEALPFGVSVWDSDDRLVMANERILTQCRAFGIELTVGCERSPTVSAALRAGFFGSRYVGLGLAAEPLVMRRSAERLPTNEVVSVERISDTRWVRFTSYISPANWLLSFFEEIPAPEAEDVRSAVSPAYQRVLLKYVTDFIVHVGHSTRIEYVNEAFAQAMGKPVSELIGAPSSEIFNDVLGTQMVESLKDVTPENAVFSFDQRWRKAGGDFAWLRWRAHALFDGSKPVGVIATGRDITVEYAQQTDLKHQSEELEKKNRSLEQFAAVVSHDLKAPLRHISVFADMMVEEAGKGNLEELSGYAQQVRQSAQRMDRVVRKLLEYSQIAYKIVASGRVTLAEVTIQAIQNIEGQIEEAKAEVLLSRLPVFVGDPDLMRQVMQNLIANAVKYRRKGVAPRVRIYASEVGSLINIFIEDNGIGIEPRFADTIFSAFQRLHRDDKVYDGFGIGLALCRQIVESHKGSIELDTTYSAGARFVIRLPRHLKLPE